MWWHAQGRALAGGRPERSLWPMAGLQLSKVILPAGVGVRALEHHGPPARWRHQRRARAAAATRWRGSSGRAPPPPRSACQRAREGALLDAVPAAVLQGRGPEGLPGDRPAADGHRHGQLPQVVRRRLGPAGLLAA